MVSMSPNPLNVQVKRTTTHSPQTLTRSVNRPAKDGQKEGVSTVPTENGEKIKEVIDRMEKMAGVFNTKLSYDVDKRTDQLVVRIIDKETEEVIRQIPPPELLNLAARFEEMKGIIFNGKG